MPPLIVQNHVNAVNHFTRHSIVHSVTMSLHSMTCNLSDFSYLIKKKRRKNALMSWEEKFLIVSYFWYFCGNCALLLNFVAIEQVNILQNETSSEAVFWFGAKWNSTMKEYISEKGIFWYSSNISLSYFQDGSVMTELVTQNSEKTTTYYLELYSSASTSAGKFQRKVSRIRTNSSSLSENNSDLKPMKYLRQLFP